MFSKFATAYGPERVTRIMRLYASKVKPVAASFYAQLGRRIYISPKSYLDFLQTFLNMLHERQRALSKRLGRYVTGCLNAVTFKLPSISPLTSYRKKHVSCVMCQKCHVQYVQYGGRSTLSYILIYFACLYRGYVPP